MIHIKFSSGIYTLSVKQKLAIPINHAWQFFSSPKNLALITPPELGFVITSGMPDDMYAGQIISYQVSPLAGFRTNWVSEITQVHHEKYFVDEQRIGPYKMWHHEHHFKSVSDGIIMEDKVSYQLPLGLIGRFAHFLFVEKQLRNIFRFRAEKLHTLFGCPNES
ncbi:SRPBCC family protein [Mangrovibacterium marinum]|nr:SRPBCC family protein [Mangrovibacterium marinum]